MGTFVIGFDLGKEYSQICCWNEKSKEPVSVAVEPGTEKYRIPTETTEAFLKKAMRLLKPYGKIHEAAAVVFCVEQADEQTAAELRRAAMQMIGIPESRIFVQSREESFCAYVLHQPREIWRHQSVLFTCEGGELRSAVLNVNGRTIPAMARAEKEEKWQTGLGDYTNGEKDLALSGIARDIFGGRPVSSVFLVGEGFDGKWYEESLKILCSAGKRVFAGNNLFAKGACYRAMEELKNPEERSYVFLGEDKIPYNVGIRTPGTGKDSLYTLLNAGTSWYEAKAQCEALLLDEPVLEFILKPMQGNMTMKESLELTGIPERPSRTTRLRIFVEFEGVEKLRIEVRDLGFGELFPSSDMVWNETVDLSQEGGARVWEQ